MDGKVQKVAKRTGYSATRAEIRQLISDQDYRCSLSGIQLTPENAALDHILPVANGGTHLIENLQVLDERINRMKNTLSNDEFIDLCRKVTQWCA